MTFTTNGGIEWEKDDDAKTLKILPSSTPESGYTVGQMKNFNYYGPWGSILEGEYRLYIGEGVTNIGSNAFFQCSGLSVGVAIPTTVTAIGSYAFYKCTNLEYLSFHGNQPSIGVNAFVLGTSATRVTCRVESTGWANATTLPESEYTDFHYWVLDGGCIWQKLQNGSAYILMIESTPFPMLGFVEGYMDDHAFDRPWGEITQAGSTLELGDGVIKIGQNSFEGCSGFTGALTLPVTLEEIGGSAFEGCSGFTELDLIHIHEETRTVLFGSYCFKGCTGFTGDLFISMNIQLEQIAFHGCTGFNGTLKIEGTNALPQHVFEGCCNFTSVVIMEEPSGIEQDAFKLNTSSPAKTYLMKSDGWANATTFPEYDYTKWDFAWIIDGGIEYYKDETNKILHIRPTDSPEEGFTSGQMKDYTSIGPWGTITETGWKLNLESGVTNIGKMAFYKCTGFTSSLTIPSSVTTINDSAFSGCSGFTGTLAIPNSVTTIGSWTFRNCTGLTGTLTIPNSVTTIGSNAFNGCTGFTGLTISNNLSSIGEGVFNGCKGFRGSLTIPNSVTSISGWAFQNCGFNGTVTFGSGLTSIGQSAFTGCASFTGSLVFPSGFTTIGNNAFNGCTGFNGTLTLPSGFTSIGEGAFNGCTGLTGTLVIPNSVTSISGWAFQNCRGFTGTLTLPSELTSIGENAFYGCSSLSCVEFLGSQPTLGSKAFLLDSAEPETRYDVKSNGWANSTTFPEYDYTKWDYITFAGILKKKISGTYKQGILWRKISGTYKQGRLWKNIGGIWR